MEFLRIGKFKINTNEYAQTLINCPSPTAFAMDVYSLTSNSVDQEGVEAWTYRLRVIRNLWGEVFVQACHCEDDPTDWEYGE